MNLLAEVSVLIDQIGRDRPLAHSCVDRGDGLRSPTFDPRVSGGGSSGSVQERVVEAADTRDDQGRLRHNPAAKLAQAEDDLQRARVELVNAYADAHRRTKEETHGR